VGQRYRMKPTTWPVYLIPANGIVVFSFCYIKIVL
jgi:hypothetical protein